MVASSAPEGGVDEQPGAGVKAGVGTRVGVWAAQPGVLVGGSGVGVEVTVLVSVAVGGLVGGTGVALGGLVAVGSTGTLEKLKKSEIFSQGPAGRSRLHSSPA